MAPKGRKMKGQAPQQRGQHLKQEHRAAVQAHLDYEVPELKRTRGPAWAEKYLDENLPPMDSLEDIFQDITDKAMRLGFANVLRRLGDRPLRVATVCSGTESPLLALEMIMKSLNGTEWRLQISHLFSCEIVAFKQAYIERNFKPPILFRDLQELAGSEALTAYGSPVPIPGNIDIMIAGTACVDFSMLNDKRKTLADLGESGSTFYALLKHAQRYRPRIIIMENVRTAPWDRMVDSWAEIEYASTYFVLDSKKYYIPQTRQRGYMVCIDKRCPKNEAGGESINERLSELIEQFTRQASSPAGKFILSENDIQLEKIWRDLSTRLEASSLRATVLWEKYKTRHQQHRSVMKLGTQRPISLSRPGGVVCQPPDHFQWQWFKAQVERIWDTVDIKYLLDVSKGLDMMSKERFLDLSQGVDRGSKGDKTFGVAGCLTPMGMPFVTSLGRPLTGLESIVLQGLPKDRLMLTRESQRDLQDLAGNAMTSTVVCAVILAALITHYNVLDEGAEVTEPQADVQQTTLFALEEDEAHLTIVNGEVSSTQSINLDDLQLSAHRSARYCACEKQSGVKNSLLKCSQCGHTACRLCAGNPAHVYEALALDRKQPLDFVAELKSILPMRLVFEGLSEKPFEEFRSSFPGDSEAGPSDDFSQYIDIVRAVFADEVRFFDISRAEKWTVTYEGEHCSLQLSITHDACQWFVFGKPPRTSPARCLLREILAKPIAQVTTTSTSRRSLLDGEWKICAPISVGFWLAVTGLGDQVQSYQARCGLQMAVHATSKVWSQIEIDVEDDDAWLLGVDVRGLYDFLPECGTSLGSLYRKPASASSPAVSLFFDPSRHGDPQHDSCVLSLEHHRLAGYAPRMTIAELSPCWRALQVKKGSSRVRAFARPWQKVSGAALRLSTAERVVYRTLSTGTLVLVGDKDCHQSLLTLVSLKAVASTLNLSGQPTPWQARESARSTDLKGLAWAVQKVAAVVGFLNWKPIEVASSLLHDATFLCETCQPTPPKLLWGRDSKGRITPYEDPQGAATFERAVKSKPSAFLVLSRVDENGLGELRFVLNIQTLAHQVFARFVDSNISEGARLSWRLIPSAYDAGREQSKRMVLRGNKDDRPSDQPPNFRLTLREEQLRSLTWMVAQEAEDIEPFMEQETEEAILPLMSWRAEVRASSPRKVRGGVVADEVGYGKTAIVLALIDAQMKKDRGAFAAGPDTPEFIATNATLIVVPGNIFYQWASEIEKFLGKKTYSVLKIKDSSALTKTTIQDIREADIVLVSWGLFKTNPYYQAMQHFTGAPRVPSSGIRNFDNWFAEAERLLRQLVPVLKNDGAAAFLNEVLKRRRELKKTQSESTYIPSKRLRGAAFALAQEQRSAGVEAAVDPGSPMDGMTITAANTESHAEEEPLTESSVEETDDEAAEEQTGKRKLCTSRKQVAKKKWNYRQKLNIDKDFPPKFDKVSCPPLHAFSYNRLVIDEFMHAEELRQTSLLTISARSKWILSGTPAVQEFADIKTMAGYLGVHLGIDDDADAPTSNWRLKLIRRCLTAVESFRLYQPPRSSAWYKERHNQAQRFVDRFVRQNSPNIDFIPLTHHAILTKQFPAERDTYEKLYAHLQTQQGNAKRIRNPFDDPLICRLNKFLGESHELPEHVALIKCAVTADMRDFAWDSEDCAKRLETHNGLLDEHWTKLSSVVKEMTHARRQWRVDASIWESLFDDVFAHSFDDSDIASEARVRMLRISSSYDDSKATEETSEIEKAVAERFKKIMPSKTTPEASEKLADRTESDDEPLRQEDREHSEADSAIGDVLRRLHYAEDQPPKEQQEEIEDRQDAEASSDDNEGVKRPQKRAKTSSTTTKPKPTTKARWEAVANSMSKLTSMYTSMPASKPMSKPTAKVTPRHWAKPDKATEKEKGKSNRQAKEKVVRRKFLDEIVSGVRKVVQASRDIRFFTATQNFHTAMQHQCQGCSESFDDGSSVVVVRSCGHLLCLNCISASVDKSSKKTHSLHPSKTALAGNSHNSATSTCQVSGCNGSTETSMLVPGQSLMNTNATNESGKLAAMIDVIQQTPDEELVLLFVQFFDLIDVASRVLESANIEHRVAKTGRDAKFIAEFTAPASDSSGDQSSGPKKRGRPAANTKAAPRTKANLKSSAIDDSTSETQEGSTTGTVTGSKGHRPKVLILPVGSSMAAGLNLQTINHVIFLSPLILPEQSEWESGMTQAIGRVRRYGQKRDVHIYHLLSKDTADVTIFKEREENRIDEATRRTLVWRGESVELLELKELKNCEAQVEGPSLTFEQRLDIENSGGTFEENVDDDVEDEDVGPK